MKKIALTGLITLLIAIAMSVSTGGSPPPFKGQAQTGYATAIVAFEFASNAGELQAAIGPLQAPETALLQKGLQTSVYIDFPFLLGYSALMLLLGFAHYRAGALNALLAAGTALLAVCMALGDILENLELLKILALPPGAETGFAFKALIFWTHVKWYAIFIACLTIAYGYARMAGFSLLLSIAVLFAASGFIGILGLIFIKPLVELASLFLALAWIAATGHAIKHWRA